MTHLQVELDQLKISISDMIKLAIEQLMKAEKAIEEIDQELAQEIIHRENRMNAMELSIDRDCENIFALYNPVATDLRFVLAILKINSELERIGDHAVGLAKYVLDSREPFNTDLTALVNLEEMFRVSISMLHDIKDGFEEESTSRVRQVFQKDLTLNDILRKSSDIIATYVQEKPTVVRQSLFLFSALRKLERVGDLTKNIAEQTIFYLEAEVVRHKKGKK